jgi:two-component sensor histidine kinase
MTMARSPRDEALSVYSQYQSIVSSVIAMPSVPSEFESIVLLSGELPPKDGDLINVLLASAHLVNDSGCEVLRPLWTEEAMHRIHGFMRLIGARSRRGSRTRQNPIAAAVEDFAARDLAAKFGELETSAERAVLPCSTVLRDVVSDLGTLFGCPASIALETRIERVLLPGYKRRALVLAACELLCNALLHAFPGHETGLIEVGLTFLGRRSACLRAADNGIGFGDILPNLTCGVAAGLADLLEADLAYTRAAGWTVAEICFPARGA